MISSMQQLANADNSRCILNYMNKRVITTMAGVGGTIGAAVPMLFGDYALLDSWTILWGMVGGLVGIWAGVWISKRY